MAWDHLAINKPHLVYIILGGFTSLFMLCSTFIKERLYIGEATVATICGVIFGPHAADLINPMSWGNTDQITLEFSRIVLVVQCFAVGVELPKFYMEKHWKSVTFLLVPVMTYGWLVTSLFIWWMVPTLSWLESLAAAACVTATDPVLASSVVGKGKFARRVPKHLRDLLSAESGCNDGMAFPFIYLALYLIVDHQDAGKVSYHWIVYTILYECIFGAVYGFLIGYIARHGIKIAERHDLIDRESFLVFYFVLALFCAGSGSILGVDDLLVGFAAGVGFSNDGWFTQKTEESHVSNVIDLLLNLAYFVYLGTIIPWEQYNDSALGLTAWKLVIIALFVILFRRIPIMLALKPLIADIKTWREALFAGHFGPIGVGAIFVAILARLELEGEEATPLAPDEIAHLDDNPNKSLILLIWPITTFLVIASIIVHGSSVAVFTLGKRINTLTITMSYTTAHEDGPSWMNRLPRISSQSRSQAKTFMSDTDGEEVRMPDGVLLRRQKSEDGGSRSSSLVPRYRKKTKLDMVRGPGGPISESAIRPARRTQSERASTTTTTLVGPSQSTPSHAAVQEVGPLSAPDRHDTGQTLVAEKVSPQPPTSRRREKDIERDPEKDAAGLEDTPSQSPSPRRGTYPDDLQLYEEGSNIIIENRDGDVLDVRRNVSNDAVAPDEERGEAGIPVDERRDSKTTGESIWTLDGWKKRFGDWKNDEIQKRKEKDKGDKKHEPARAFQFGNTIILEDEDGEVLKKWELPPQRGEGAQDLVSQGLKYMGMGALVKGNEASGEAGPSEPAGGATSGDVAPTTSRAGGWATGWGFGGGGVGGGTGERKKSVFDSREEEDDRNIRVKMSGVDRRMTKDDFLSLIQQLDPKLRGEVIDRSDASKATKILAREGGVAAVRRESRAGSDVRPGPALQFPSGAPQHLQHLRAPHHRRRSLSESGGSSSRETPSTSRSPSSGRHDRLRSPDSSDQPSQAYPETAAERRRRMSVLQSVSGGRGAAEDIDDGGDVVETPAERRRREAALGMGSSAAAGRSNRPVAGAAVEDSDDDDTPRVPPVRRGIRFADSLERGRQ